MSDTRYTQCHHTGCGRCGIGATAPNIQIRTVEELNAITGWVYLTFALCFFSLPVKVIGFFSQRLEQAGSDLSVERVQEVIMKGAQALPTDRLKVTHTHTHTHAKCDRDR